jgi:hypothetical protein
MRVTTAAVLLLLSASTAFAGGPATPEPVEAPPVVESQAPEQVDPIAPISGKPTQEPSQEPTLVEDLPAELPPEARLASESPTQKPEQTPESPTQTPEAVQPQPEPTRSRPDVDPEATAQTYPYAGTYRLAGREEGGSEVDVELELRPGRNGRYAVRRIVSCAGTHRTFIGVGTPISDGRVRVEMSEPRGMRAPLEGIAEQQPERFTAFYSMGGELVLGIFRGPSCAGPLGLTEETGARNQEDLEPVVVPTAPSTPLVPSSPTQDPTTPTPTTPSVRPIPSPSDLIPAEDLQDADDQLAAMQRAAVRVAQSQLGVREASPNRGPEIDRYASTAGMPSGTAWCGYFASYCYTQAAQAQGRDFAGQRRLHSVGKTRDYYVYRSYTDTWTADRVSAWEAERADDAASGSQRRFMALAGSEGAEFGARRSASVEVFQSHSELPIRAGDQVMWSWGEGRGHIGLVESYDPSSGALTTIEGNAGDAVRRRSYDLSSPQQRNRVLGFGRPALSDFE